MKKGFVLTFILALFSFACSFAQEPVPPSPPPVMETQGINWEDIALKGGLGLFALGLVFKYVVGPITAHNLATQDRLTASNELLAKAVTGMPPAINASIIEAERRLESLIRETNDDMRVRLTEILDILKHPPAASGPKQDG